MLSALLDFDLSHRRAIYSNPHLPAYDTLPDSPTSHVELRTLLPRSVDVLIELRSFPTVVEQALLTSDARLDPEEFIEAYYSIQHQLLTIGPVEYIPDEGLINSNDELGEAFRLGAII